MRPRLRRIAAAGNTAAVALLAMVYAHGPALLGRAETSPAPPMGSPKPRVLLVVIDALREDRSRDPRLMPNLNRLQGRGTARVESWIPSTVAGIRTIVEGTVPPPASFLQDFGASRSHHGGIFAAAKSAGLRTFAAGPRLWEDLYGPWLDGAFSVTTVSADDERVLQEGLAALRRDYDLVVVHLSAADDAAHVHGGRSREYLDALRRADAALGRLLDAAGPETRIVVTSDHGVTDDGGHAGPEPAVVETPVVVRGLGNPGEIRQRDLHRLVQDHLPGRSKPAGGTPAVPGGRLLIVVASLGCALILCSRLVRGEEEWRSAVLLDAALWASLILAVLGWTPAALLITLAALAFTALRRSPGAPSPAALAALGAGLAFGLLRLQASWAASLGLLAVCGLAAALGWALRRPLPSHPLMIGWICGALPAVLAWLLGETASLSTLDVRFAFRLADGPLGLPGAVTAVVLLQALPTLALLAALAPVLARAAPGVTGSFAAGAALALTGQAGASALALALFPGPLAVGLLVRLIGEVTFLFLGLAILSRRPGTDAL
ncbi:MAG TPA: alkaline phosphatase family protein [Thermoanaerobaculia bacterium]|nr:alkaline phosphatase family protein [Thermoanaerobaculia bacterium]